MASNVVNDCIEYIGEPCRIHANYKFFKSFKYLNASLKWTQLSLGSFFFVQISSKHDPCIGELKLLWHDQNSNNHLSSLRLYFLPEQSPQGRLVYHGQVSLLFCLSPSFSTSCQINKKQV